FSSRRRHTRSKRDWSLDVCSSDLNRCFLFSVFHGDTSCDLKFYMSDPHCGTIPVHAFFAAPVPPAQKEGRPRSGGWSRIPELHRSEERRVGKDGVARWAR